ncbi:MULTISPECIES: hypothetical protein [unclassified Ketobacter]|uniref:hypothetical protein n=1 Tax=unclassified Ketobacter TaxID=2639109 RepID=UPI0025C339DE|nr:MULTISPECIES: hypothetical protein [unclassified Ketobacter]
MPGHNKRTTQLATWLTGSLGLGYQHDNGDESGFPDEEYGLYFFYRIWCAGTR